MIDEEKNISGILKQAMNIDDITDLCINIELSDNIVPFCFIRSETPTYLIVDATDDNGLEKVVIIAKKEIITVSVVYQDEIDSIFETDDFTEKERRLYQ